MSLLFWRRGIWFVGGWHCLVMGNRSGRLGDIGMALCWVKWCINVKDIPRADGYIWLGCWPEEISRDAC